MIQSLMEVFILFFFIFATALVLLLFDTIIEPQKLKRNIK